MGSSVKLLLGGGGVGVAAVPRAPPAYLFFTTTTTSSFTRRRVLLVASHHHSNTTNNDSSSNNNNRNINSSSPISNNRVRASSPTVNGSLPKPKKKQQQQQQQKPSVLEIQRAIGVLDGGDGGSDLRPSDGSRPFSMLDLLALTPIGQPEGPLEKKLREAGEWLVERTESRGHFGQRILMVVYLIILPVWLFLLLVCFGVINLPMRLPFMDDLLS